MFIVNTFLINCVSVVVFVSSNNANNEESVEEQMKKSMIFLQEVQEKIKESQDILKDIFTEPPDDYPSDFFVSNITVLTLPTVSTKFTTPTFISYFTTTSLSTLATWDIGTNHWFQTPKLPDLPSYTPKLTFKPLESTSYLPGWERWSKKTTTTVNPRLQYMATLSDAVRLSTIPVFDTPTVKDTFGPKKRWSTRENFVKRNQIPVQRVGKVTHSLQNRRQLQQKDFREAGTDGSVTKFSIGAWNLEMCLPDEATDDYIPEEEQLRLSVSKVNAFFVGVQKQIRENQAKLRQIQNEPYLRPFFDPFGDSTKIDMPTISLSNYVVKVFSTSPYNISSTAQVSKQMTSKATATVTVTPSVTTTRRVIVSTVLNANHGGLTSYCPTCNAAPLVTSTKPTLRDAFIRQGPPRINHPFHRAIMPDSSEIPGYIRRGSKTATPVSIPRRSPHKPRRYYKSLKKHSKHVTRTAKHTQSVQIVPTTNIFSTLTTAKPLKHNHNVYLRQITGASSYSDEEMALKVNLMDQVFHHGKDFNRINVRKVVLEEPRHSDDEMVLMQHLDKALKSPFKDT